MKKTFAVAAALMLLVLCGCNVLVSNRLPHVKSITLYYNGQAYAIPKDSPAYTRIIRQTEDLLSSPLNVCKCSAPTKEDVIQYSFKGNAIMIELDQSINIKLKTIPNETMTDLSLNTVGVSLAPDTTTVALMQAGTPALYTGKKGFFEDIHKTATIYMKKTNLLK